jgi:hypothetical protein
MPDRMRELNRWQALFAVSPDGRITFANRTARLMAGIDAARLEHIPGFGRDMVAMLHALPLGARKLATLDDGRAMLVRAVSFATPGEAPQRLLSFQTVSDDLDVVQVGAWRAMTRMLAHEMMNSLTPVASLSESPKRLVARRGAGGGGRDGVSVDPARVNPAGRPLRRGQGLDGAGFDTGFTTTGATPFFFSMPSRSATLGVTSSTRPFA